MSSRIQRSAALLALALPAAACLAAWPHPWAGHPLRLGLAAPLGAHTPEGRSYPSEQCAGDALRVIGDVCMLGDA
jgi:hypothetical protein